jgi:hypothetical protein
MDPAPKKVSLFQYKQKRESSTSLTEHQPASDHPPNSPIPNDLEGKLNAMLDKNLILIADRVATLPTLMRSESKETAKIMLLNFILKFNVASRFPFFAESQLTRDVLYNWLKICLISFTESHPESPASENRHVLMLIFDLLEQFVFSQEFLKNSKYLKVMNKLTELADETIASKANEFFHAWNRIIATGNSTVAASCKSNVNSNDIFPVRQTTGSCSRGGRLLASNLQPSSEGTNKFSQRTKATDDHNHHHHAARDRDIPTTSTTTTKKPVEANDDQVLGREKRASNPAAQHESTKKSRSKRVSFAADELLVRIKYFEIEQDPEHVNALGNNNGFYSMHRGKADYHEAEREEASFALKRLAQVNRPQLTWRNPALGPLIEVPIGCRIAWGSKSIEAKVQQERERRVLSVTYYGNQPLPSSPAEPKGEEACMTPESIIPRIPLYDVKAQGSSAPIDSDALLALVHNPELMRRLQSI